MAVFDITNDCNLNCSYCNRKKNKNIIIEPSLEKILYVYNQIQKNGIHYLSLQGGEPLLRNDIEHIVNSIGCKEKIESIPIRQMWTDMILQYNKNRRLKMQSAKIILNCHLPMVSITTNGSVFYNDLIKLLAKFNFYVEISIDSLNESINQQRRCGVRQNTVIENINKYAKKVPSILNVTVGTNNIDSILEIILFAQDCGCIKVVLNPQFDTYNCMNSSREWENLYINMIYYILDFFQSHNLNVLVECIIPRWFFKSDRSILLMQKKANSIPNWLFVPYICHAYTSLEDIYISPELKVFPCPQFSQILLKELGSLNDNTLSDLWEKRTKLHDKSKVKGCLAENLQRIGI